MFANGLIASLDLPCPSSPKDITLDRARGLSDHKLLPDALFLVRTILLQQLLERYVQAAARKSLTLRGNSGHTTQIPRTLVD
jgi:hypothetical protein